MKFIPLNQGKVAVVDDEDYDRIMALGKWRCNRWGYAAKTIHVKTVSGKKITKNLLMHRFIMDAPDGVPIDHLWGDKLDNRKENLRFCSYAENNRNKSKSKANTSGFKGVSWNAKSRKWEVAIKVGSKTFYLGVHTCPIEAACLYNVAAREYHGEFARLNPIPKDYIVDDEKINLLFKNHSNKMVYSSNTSGFNGVSWNKEKRKWSARIYVNSKKIHLGYFSSPIDAAKAYNAAAIKYHGEFAKLNVISEESTPQALNLSAQSLP